MLVDEGQEPRQARSSVARTVQSALDLLNRRRSLDRIAGVIDGDFGP